MFLRKRMDKTSFCLMKKVFREGLCSVNLNNKCTDDSFGTSWPLEFHTIHFEVTLQFDNFIAMFN